MPHTDHYATLEVDRQASPDAIKLAFRRLARKLHPDVSRERDAEARFKALREAYEILRNPVQRSAYDRFMRKLPGNREFKAAPNFSRGFAFKPHDRENRNFSDLFDTSLFESTLCGKINATGVAKHNPATGNETEILIDLQDAYTGAKRMVSLRRRGIDTNGATGLMTQRIEIVIPRGAQSGDRIPIPGDGSDGDELFLKIGFRTDGRWQVNGKHVLQELPITPWEAALGALVQIVTPGGTVEVAIPAGSQARNRLRLRGQGIPAAAPGDLYLQLRIAVPDTSTESARAAWRAVAAACPYDPRATSSA